MLIADEPMTGRVLRHVLGCVFAFAILCLLFADSTRAQEGSAETDKPAAEATDADSGDLKSDVLEWVDQLDAPSLSKRKLAEKKLIEAGADALKYLPQEKAGVSIEAKERLARVRKALMSAKTQTQSSAITINLDSITTLGEALEAISRDSGVEFEHQADESMKVDSVPTPLSFWHAVDLVLDQTNLDVNFYGGDRGVLALQPREEGRPSRVDSAAYAGVYRIEPTSVNARRVLNQPSQSGMNVAMEIAWEPRMTPIGLTIPIDQLSGKLDDDKSVEPQESGDTIDIATSADLAFSEFYLPLELPAGRPSKIKSLSGSIKALLPGKQQAFELALKDVNPKKTIEAMTVEVEEIRKNGPLHEVRVGLQLADADRSLESHRHWIFENPLYIKRKDGSRAEHLGYEVFRQTKDGVGIGYLFELGDSYDDAVLIYESPTAVINNEVAFVIQDIKLP
ncbi:MAG: hypothetical protein WBD20_22800 [Pirellulaceae bacterium]